MRAAGAILGNIRVLIAEEHERSQKVSRQRQRTDGKFAQVIQRGITVFSAFCSFLLVNRISCVIPTSLCSPVSNSIFRVRVIVGGFFSSSIQLYFPPMILAFDENREVDRDSVSNLILRAARLLASAGQDLAGESSRQTRPDFQERSGFVLSPFHATTRGRGRSVNFPPSH
jgi:hypothetical protein